jgi:hypothetical protein
VATTRTRALPPPQKLSEVKAWVAAHGADPAATAALEWAPGRKFAVHDACIRALMTLGGPAALDALTSYRGREAGNMEDLGPAWDHFDRCEFARRVLASPVVLGARGGLRRLDGIECVEALECLTIETADGCSLEPLARRPGLLSGARGICRGSFRLPIFSGEPSSDRLDA